VLAVRRDWANSETALSQRLIRAIWRACQWLSDPDSRILAADLLSRSGHLDLPADIIDRALIGPLTVTQQGLQRNAPGFLEFHKGSANFPWRSQAQWIALQLASRMGMERGEAMRSAAEVFRSDIYRSALRGTAAELPGASSKLEGANERVTSVPAETGTLILPPDRFFDGVIFDPYDCG